LLLGKPLGIPLRQVIVDISSEAATFMGLWMAVLRKALGRLTT